MLTAREYAFLPSQQKPEYGLLFCEDESGKRWTLVGDVGLVQMVRSLEVDGPTFETLDIGGKWTKLPGWPDEWTSPTVASDDPFAAALIAAINAWMNEANIDPGGLRSGT